MVESSQLFSKNAKRAILDFHMHLQILDVDYLDDKGFRHLLDSMGYKRDQKGPYESLVMNVCDAHGVPKELEVLRRSISLVYRISGLILFFIFRDKCSIFEALKRIQNGTSSNVYYKDEDVRWRHLGKYKNEIVAFDFNDMDKTHSEDECNKKISDQCDDLFERISPAEKQAGA